MPLYMKKPFSFFLIYMVGKKRTTSLSWPVCCAVILALALRCWLSQKAGITQYFRQCSGYLGFFAVHSCDVLAVTL